MDKMKYAKLNKDGGIEFAPVNKGSIINYNLNIEEMTKDGYKPFIKAETENGKAYTFRYEETKTAVKEIAEEVKPDPEAEARARREYLDNLTMTSADVERAIYKALKMDFDDVKALLQKFPEIDIKAIGIELRAGTFYRRHPFIDKIGALLGYTADDMDYLFENKELPPDKIPAGITIKEAEAQTEEI